MINLDKAFIWAEKDPSRRRASAFLHGVEFNGFVVGEYFFYKKAGLPNRAHLGELSTLVYKEETKK